MTEAILALVGPGDLWIADRNFCTTAFLFGIASARGLLRDPPARLDADLGGRRQAASPSGRCETGRGLRANRPTDQRRRVRSCSCGGSPWSWTSRPGTAIARSTS